MSAVAEEPAVVDEARLYDAEQTIVRMGLQGKKTARWLLDQVRADRLFFTLVGKTPMFSEQDMKDNIARMRRAPRNKFVG